MSLEYRSGRWSVIYRPAGRYGPRVRVPLPATIADETAARTWHDEFIAEWKEAGNQEERPRVRTGLSIGELWNEYLPWSELHHAATTHRDLLGIGKWIRRYIGHFPAEEIGIHHVAIYQRLRAAAASRPIQRAINKEISYLGGMVKWAGRQGYITARQLQGDRLPYRRPLPQVLSVAEIEAVIGAAEPFYQAYFLCLFALGLRSIEARRLKWHDIDFQRGSLTIAQKGGSEKSLPLSQTVIEALVKIAPPAPELDKSRGDIYVFARPRTKRGEVVRWESGPVTDIRAAIRRACAKAGVEKRVTPHMFRHSCATAMLDKNVNLRVIQRFLGHASIIATQIYTHVSMENLRSAQASISSGIQQEGTRNSQDSGDMGHTEER